MEYNNCFEVSGNWADACEGDDDMYDFGPPPLPEIKQEPEQVEKKKKKKKKVNEPKPEPEKPKNVFSLLGDSDSESETETQTQTQTETTSISSMTPQLDEIPVVVECDDDKDWKTVTKTKRGKKVIGQGSKMIICKNKWCKKEFEFTQDEQDYFAEKGWPDRTKCKECKREQKNKEKYGGMPRVNRRKTIQLD